MSALKEISLNSWADFEEEIRKLFQRRQELRSTGLACDQPLFRGLSSHKWGLETTLERSFPLEARERIADLPSYYQFVSRSLPVIETSTGKEWKNLPTPPEFTELLKDFTERNIFPQLFFGRKCFNLSIFCVPAASWLPITVT